MTGIYSENYILKQFCPCVNIFGCDYTNLEGRGQLMNMAPYVIENYIKDEMTRPLMSQVTLSHRNLFYK